MPKIVPCTAFVSEEDVQRCKNAGMDGFLAKPVSRKTLEKAFTQQFLQGEAHGLGRET